MVYVMKKFILLILSLACIVALSACGRKARPIVLPEASDITSIDITVGNDCVNYTDGIQISEIISGLSGSEPTNRESIQDTPHVQNYMKIDFQFETGTSTLFVYEENAKYYVEQPYQGIYEIDSRLYEQLRKIK